MKLAQAFIVIVIATLYLWMGYAALANPASITSVFDLPEVPAAMRNEISAVYGGFGFAFGMLLLVSHFNRSAVASGVIVSLATLTLGMAAGRMVSFCFDQPSNRYPLIFMCMELAMGGLLLWVFFSRGQTSKE